ncbi:hypothetical protein HUT16_34905 [Kitasatospora sp. NA04385]|uniref:hypothetical protein n=1 Tax=Kitasatospora sp. NA04385 TaxID=2742135 RepID=UPI0015929006|nr:hypothetical protein [Kitasatospora sp. NA04385]QKW23596.1 hypothetical protein HUT16_34905 [Kitasatospora sp. NA04385]
MAAGRDDDLDGPEITDDELLDVADNPAQAAELHRALRTLAKNDKVGPELQQMAREVLSGRIGMKDVIESDRYLSAIGARLGEMRTAAENLSPEERAASDKRAVKLREQYEAEHGPIEDEDDEPDRPYGDRR